MIYVCLCEVEKKKGGNLSFCEGKKCGIEIIQDE
jgi:hypothetical protein